MAYTYTGTPSQRIEQAQQRISDDSIAQNTMLSSYLSAVKAQNEQSAQTQPAPKAEKKWYERLGDTLGDVAKSVFTGFAKAFEGLADFGASTVGVIAGWAGNDDLKQQMTDFTARDLTGTEMWDAMRNAGLEVDFESSWINDMSDTAQNIIRGVGQGVGQMLPMIATAGVGGALGAGATAMKGIQVANLAGLGMSAAGSSTEDALNQTIVGADGKPQKVELDRAYLYGLASGAVEVATEKLVGGPFEKFTGSGIADKLINRLGKSTAFEKAVRVAAGYAGEGVEEMVSEAVSGTLQKIYDDDADATPDVEKVFEAGVIGSLTAMALGTSQQVIGKVSNTQTVQESMIDIDNIDKRAESLRKNGKLSEEKLTQLTADRQKKIETITNRYARASEKTQQKMRSALPQLADILNDDGTARDTALDAGAKEITSAQAINAMSGSLALSRKNEVANVLHSQGASIAENVTEKEMENAHKVAYNWGSLVGTKTGATAKFVLVDDSNSTKTFNGFILNDIIYLNRDVLTDTTKKDKVVLSSEDKMANAFAHETDHFAKGSKEHAEMHKFINGVDYEGTEVDDNYTYGALRRKAIDFVGDPNVGYGLPKELIDAVRDAKIPRGELNKKFGKADVDLAIDEIYAHETEFFYTAENLDRLAAENKSLAKKILNRVRTAIKLIKAISKGDEKTLASLKMMQKAEKLLCDSLANAGQDYIRKKTIIGRTVDDKEKGTAVDGQDEIQYNNEAQFSRKRSVGYEWAFAENLLKQGVKNKGKKNGTYSERKLFFDKIGELNNSGSYFRKMEDGNFLIDVNNKVVATDGNNDRPSIEWIVEFNKHSERVSEARDYFYEYIINGKTIWDCVEIVNDLFQKEVATLHISNDSTIYRESRRQGQGVGGYSEDTQRNGERAGSLDKDKGSIIHSLRDSEGNTLSEQQADYFKDSKVRDKDGNLLVVYHGTPFGGFTVFNSHLGIADKPSRANWFSTNTDIINKYYNVERLDNKGENQLYKCYLNSTNPLVIDAKGAAWNQIPTELGIYKYRNSKGDVVVSDTASTENFAKYAQEHNYDGLIIENVRDGSINDKSSTVYAVFDSNQIKLTTNTNPTTSADIRYSLKEIIDENNVSYGIGVKLDSTLLDNLSEKERIAMVKEYVKEIGGQVFTAIDDNGKRVDITIAKPNRKIKNKNGKVVSVDNDLVSKYINDKTKQEAVVLVDELIETSNPDNRKKPTYSHGWLDNDGKNDWEYWTTHIEDKVGTIWKATLNIANAESGEKILYDIYPIKKVGRSVKSDTVPTNTIIRNSDEKSTTAVKKSIRQAVDSEGNTLSEQQADYFKDSKVRDKDGNLLVVYNGVVTEKNTEPVDFGYTYTFLDENLQNKDKPNTFGFFFTDSKKTAEDYSLTWKSKTQSAEIGRINSVYLNIKNPLDLRSLGLSSSEKDFYQFIENKGVITYRSRYRSDFKPIWRRFDKEGENLRRNIESAGYDGVIFNDYGQEQGTYVAFYPEQIKLTTNTNPTTSADIRYSFKPFAEQVDDVLSGKDLVNTHVCVSEHTPQLLLDIGLEDKPMLMTATHTKTAVGKFVANKNIHYIDVQVLKNLPELIQKPAIVMDSTKPGSIVMFLNAKDTAGNPILCAILVDGRGRYNNIDIETNLVSSIYGKDTNPVGFIRKAVDDNRLLFWDKKISQELFNSPGLQLPDEVKQLDSNTIIRKFREKSTLDDKNIRFSRRGIKHEELLKSLNGMQLDYFGRAYAKIDTPSKFFEGDDRNARLAAQIEQMSTMDIGVQTKYADDLSTAIINNLMMTDVSPEELDVLMNDAHIVNQYRHKLNLKSIKAEIESKYGKERVGALFAQWQSKDGKGLGIDTIVDEMRESGFVVKSDNEADIFFEMMDALDNARTKTEKALNKRISEVMSEEEQNALHDEIRDDILVFMQEHGADADWSANYKSAMRKINSLVAQAEQQAEDMIKLATLQAQQIEEQALQESRDLKKQLALEEQQAEEKFARELAQYKADSEAEHNTELMKAQSDAADAIYYNAEYHDAVDKVWSEANSLTKMERKKYHNASDVFNEDFETLISKLSAIKYRGVLKRFGTRKIIAAFGDSLYNLNNQVLNGGLTEAEAKEAFNKPDVEYVGYLSKTVLDAIDFLRQNKKRTAKSGPRKGQLIDNDYNLTLQELQATRIVLEGARHLVETYNTINIGGESLNFQETAAETVRQAEVVSAHVKSNHKATERVRGWVYNILSPDAVIDEMFGYQNNQFTQAYNDVLNGATRGERVVIELNGVMDKFMREHKGYKKRLESAEITIGGHKVSLSTALTLYMTSRQAESWDKLTKGGWGFRNAQGYWQDCGKLDLSDIESMASVFEKPDMEFIAAVKDFINASTKYTIEGEKKMNGFSAVEILGRDNYFPFKTYSGDRATEIDDIVVNTSPIVNPGFLKERVKHTHRLEMMPILDVVSKHARQVGMYYGLAVPLKEIQRLYNCNISKDGVVSLRNTINEKSWSKFDKYLTDLLGDIQGVRRGNAGKIDQTLNWLRGNYAKFQLALNPKTILSQMAGYPAAFTILSADAMTKAWGHGINAKSIKNMLKYCDWAAVKHYEGGVVLAETVTDKLGKVTDLGTKGIQGMDTLLNAVIWNACQCEVENRHKGDADYKFGTDANMREAAELHTVVGRKTQGNSAKGEQAAMQRSTNAFVKGFAMFNSDGFKMISRVYESISRLRAIRYLEQHGEKIDAEFKRTAKNRASKAVTALLVSNLVYVLIGELFRHMLDKEPKEDKDGNEQTWLKTFGMNYLSTIIGNIPIIRDIYSSVVEGYEIDNYALAGFTDMTDAMRDVIDGISTLSSGEPYEAKDIAAPLKSLVNAVGMITGIPTRNVYNYLYGFTKRFDPSAAYEWNSVFYSNSYASDLNKAIDEGDTDLQTTIVGLMLKDDGMTDTSAKVNEKLRELHAEGLTVLPKSVSDSFSYEGEVYKMTQKQRNAFKAVYKKANDDVETLINKKGLETLPKEVQAKAIKWIYDYYYESAVYATVGEEPDSKKQLFGETMDLSKFAMTVAACAAVETSLDKKGNAIAGSRKAAILRLLSKLSLTSSERLIVLAYLGYSVEEDATRVKNYISRIGLSKTQQKVMLDYCGLAS